MDVGGQAGTLRLRRRDDEVALELGAGREAGQWANGEASGEGDRAEPEARSARCTACRSVARANSGVAPASANSVDWRSRRVEVPTARSPLKSIGPAAARPGNERDRADRRPAQELDRLVLAESLVTTRMTRDGTDDRESSDRDVVHPTIGARRRSVRQARAASGIIAATVSRPARTTSPGEIDASIGWTSSGVADGDRGRDRDRRAASHRPVRG